MRPLCAALLALASVAVAAPQGSGWGDAHSGDGYGGDMNGGMGGHGGAGHAGNQEYGSAYGASAGASASAAASSKGASAPASASASASATSSNAVSAASSSRASASPSAGSGSAAPMIQLQNGSYYGVHSSSYNQDFFLGIPFAQPPLGELRFTNPQSLNQSWANAVPATQYAKECVGYGGDQIGYEVSEDCLYLNVIRPSGYENQDLPVAVWIHGGGFYQGGTPDRRYNLSFIVENSVQIGKPIIGVSIAYRLNAWGFLNSNEVKGSGQTNIGLRDQRLALHWIQENIKAFGGAPEKVAIWGESAGAASVGFQLTAYNGRDDKLFRAGIMESGNPVAYGALNGTDFYQPLFDRVVSAAGCSDASDKLDCLRHVPFATLNRVLNNTNISTSWNPAVDGDFIQRYTSIQLAEGDFVKVPIISGANSDEGTAFSPQGINTTADFQYWLQTTTSRQYALPQPLVQSLLTAYPDISDQGIPSSASLGGDVRLGPPFGAQYRRSAAYFGDEVFIANRRLTCQTWASASVPAYCYRFNAIPTGITWPTQVTHFQEVAFVFNNLAGLGYAVNPFENKSSAYTDLSKFMSNSWASFVYDLEPNSWQGRDASIGQWPVYDTAKPQDFVFDANVTSYAEPDTYRQAGIELITRNNIAYHR